MVQEFHIDDFDALENVVQGVVDQFGDIDYTPELEQQQEKLQRRHQSYFEGQTNPSGRAWPALSPRTIARKGHDTILFESGRLRDSLIADSADSIREVTREGSGNQHGLAFGTTVPYSIFHQEPTTLPQRQHVGLNEEATNALAEDIADATVRGLQE